ncbi:putative ABC transport system permease protein [Streptomyces sp. TLI_55]|uniref:FtsX-like permease family protein n=1 Tax=Streptomyces sp. TLI_55 TaxID=1938861 RepID=UPI000BD9BA94|nr:ABC transporter permease [Streptomyces sp. TLI_55]SNX88434.1 putative ABC transport system permease protein [Streptomyces sp. TLI_55]
MFRSVLRSVLRDRHRFLLPALAVLIGVACVSGSLLYTQSLARGAAQVQRASRPDVSVEVRPTAGGAPPGEALLRRLTSLPGVAGVRGTLRGRAFLVARDDTLVGTPSADAGVDYVPGARGADPRYPLAEGHAPDRPGEVAVDQWAARKAGYRVGDRVRIVVAGEVRQVRLTGVFTVYDPATAAGGTLIAFDEATARTLFAPAPGRYASLTLTADPGVPPAALAERVTRELPHGLAAVTRAQLDAEAAAAPDREKLGTLLLLFAGIALFVSAFLVSNTFTMLSAVRAREHALLRAVGASRRRVLGIVLTEAAVVGAAAAVVGYGLGIGVAALLTRLFGAVGGPVSTAAPDALSPLVLVTALCVGVGFTAAAAFVPALRASAVAPVAALRTDTPAAALSLRRRNRYGTAVTAGGALLLAAADGDLGVLCLATPVLLAGLLLLTPQLAHWATRALGRPTRSLLGVRGTLALANTRRNPRRTAATAGALTVCLALVSAVTVALASLSSTAAREATADMPTDLRITAVDYAEIGTGTATQVAHLPGVAAVSAVREAGIRLSDGSVVWSAAVSPRAVGRGHLAPLTVQAGDLDDLSHGIAVTRSLAAEHGWRLGDRITGRRLSDAGDTVGKDLRLKIVAVYDGPDALSPALLPESAVAGKGDITSVLVRAEPGRTAAVKEEIRRTLHNPLLVVEDRADAGRAAEQGFGQLRSVLYAMLSITVAVAALGVANTMGMAVFERRREIGLLRAVGLDRPGVRSMLRVESVLVSALGAALGIAAGGAAGAAAVVGQHGAVLAVPWTSLLALFAGAAAVGVLAALGPGVRAAAVPVPQAVGGETG